MSRNMNNKYAYKLGFPRVSGDEPRVARARRVIVQFSPRERG